MKPKPILAALLLLITFTSCKKENETDPRQTYLIKTSNYLGSVSYIYDDNNRLVSENFETADASVTSNSTTTYSDFTPAGNPTKVTHHVPSRSTTTISVVEYDANDRLVKLSNYNTSNVLVNYYTYTYLSNTISETSYYPTGAFSQRMVYTYDQKDNVSSLDIYNYTNTHVQRVTYNAYDDRKSVRDLVNSIRKFTYPVNNVTAYEISQASIQYQYNSVHEYNADGYVTKTTTTNKTTGQERISTYEYLKK